MSFGLRVEWNVREIDGAVHVQGRARTTDGQEWNLTASSLLEEGPILAKSRALRAFGLSEVQIHNLKKVGALDGATTVLEFKQ